MIARVRVLVHWRERVAEGASGTREARILATLCSKVLISSANGTVSVKERGSKNVKSHCLWTKDISTTITASANDQQPNIDLNLLSFTTLIELKFVGL